MYQKLLSEKRSIEEKLEVLERQANNTSSYGVSHNMSDLSLSSYQENGCAASGDAQSVSNF